jgi:hypothetical protein
MLPAMPIQKPSAASPTPTIYKHYTNATAQLNPLTIANQYTHAAKRAVAGFETSEYH